MKKALVTGGTRGLGAAISARLRDAGYQVTVTGTSPRGTAPRGCLYLQCDFADLDQVEAASRHAARMRLSVLVNNAGINRVAPVQELAPADYREVQQVNVEAPFRLCAAVLPGMRRRRYGRILNITSIYGVVSCPGRAAYSASKFGLLGLSRAMALEAAADNVLVNCLAPGFIDTDLTRRVLGAKGMRLAASRVPLRRLAKPDEIARFAAFLVGTENSYATGQNFVVDGGYTSA